MAPTKIAPAPGDEYMLDIAFGQSWVDDNGKPGVLEPFTHVQDANVVLMPDDRYGADAVSYHKTPRAPFGLTSYHERDPELQTLMGPYGLRWAHDARQAGRFPGILVASGGHGGYKLERLAPKDFPWADRNTDLTPVYDNLLGIVTSFRDALLAQGQRLRVRYIPWIHGAANAGSTAENYKDRLGMLFDRLASDICTITGQRMSPSFLIVQPPGGVRNGAWENLQAQVDLALSRADCVFVGASWHIDQHDGLHYSNHGVLQVAEILALAARTDANGAHWDAPYIIKDSVQREGVHITGKFSVPVVHDVSDRTPRHYEADLKTPIPHFGFEYRGAKIKRATLIGATRFEIELDQPCAGRLAYAWHDQDRRPDPKTDKARNQSANRGTLRAQRQHRSLFSSKSLSIYLASFFKDV